MFLPASCPGCSRPGRGPCSSCRAQLGAGSVRRVAPGLDSLIACAWYDGVVAEMVQALKFRGARQVIEAMALAMGSLATFDVDAICWIPVTRQHLRHRGYDQGALLARAVATRIGRPSRALLRRGRGPPQVGRSRSQRLRGPALSARRGPPGRVLVVDDVVTTGASFEAAALVLRGGGCRVVHGIAVAATRR